MSSARNKNKGTLFEDIARQAMNDVFTEILTEGVDEDKMINFGRGRTYPNYGQAVVLAGGGGVGKSHVIKNLLPINGKQLDVDSFKEKYVKLLHNPDSKVRQEDPRIGDHPFEHGYEGMSPEQAYQMSNPDDVFALHINTSDWKPMQRNALRKGMIRQETLPNVIFDITGKSYNDIMSCVNVCKGVGYTMHLVWVIASRSRALQQNFSRERKVPQEILHKAHNQVMELLPNFITSEAGKYFEHCWLVFNSQAGLDGSPVENPCVELPKDGDKFTLTPDIAERIYNTLGPAEVNPKKPQTYLDASEITPDVNKYDRSYRGDHSYVRK